MEQELLISSKIGRDMKKHLNFRKDISAAIQQFCNNDWGDISSDAEEANEYAEKYGGTVVGHYQTCLGSIYIISTDVFESPIKSTLLYEEEL